MQYIRLENEITTTDCLAKKDRKLTPGIITKLKQQGMKIIEVGHSIEELCDEFIVASYSAKEKHIFHSLMGAKKFQGYMLTLGILDTRLFGAVWIKGEDGELILKTVAEKNEKGELELL